MASDETAAASYRQPWEQVLRALGTDARNGLGEDAARGRLREHGPNELAAERRIPAWRKLLAQFKDVLVILLLIATVISTVIWIIERDAPLPYEAMAILAVVLLNAVVGYLQESRAESALAALRIMAAPQARVLRAGQTRAIPAAEVVPGDIILLQGGRADLRGSEPRRSPQHDLQRYDRDLRPRSGRGRCHGHADGDRTDRR